MSEKEERVRALEEAVAIAHVQWRRRINGTHGGFTGFLDTPERQAWDEFRDRAGEDPRFVLSGVRKRAESGTNLWHALRSPDE